MTRDAMEVAIEVRDGVAWVIIDRPEASNAARPETMRQLCDALDRCIEDENIIAIVLTGRGRHFLAGGDFGFLQGVAAGQIDPFKTVYRWFQGAARRLFDCPKPTIAAVRGAAITVGCELALVCDVRIADTSAFFQESWLDLGLIPPLGGSLLLPRLVGLGLAKEMVLEARRVGAEEAQRSGLISQLVEPHLLEEAAQARALAMASRCAKGFAMAKQLLHRGLESTMAREWEAGVAAQAMLLNSKEFRERLAAKTG